MKLPQSDTIWGGGGSRRDQVKRYLDNQPTTTTDATIRLNYEKNQIAWDLVMVQNLAESSGRQALPALPPTPELGARSSAMIALLFLSNGVEPKIVGDRYFDRENVAGGFRAKNLSEVVDEGVGGAGGEGCGGGDECCGGGR